MQRTLTILMLSAATILAVAPMTSADDPCYIDITTGNTRDDAIGVPATIFGEDRSVYVLADSASASPVTLWLEDNGIVGLQDTARVDSCDNELYAADELVDLM